MMRHRIALLKLASASRTLHKQVTRTNKNNFLSTLPLGNDLENNKSIFQKDGNDFKFLNKINTPISLEINSIIKAGKLENAIKARFAINKAIKNGKEIDSDSIFQVIKALSENRGSVKDTKNAAIYADDLLQLLKSKSNCPESYLVSARNDVIKAWANSSLKGSGEKTENLLDEIEFSCKASKNSNLCIPYESYLYTIMAFGRERNSESGPNAERILRRMLNDYRLGLTLDMPCNKIYTSVITAYAQSASVEAAEKAESLLLEMLTLSSSGDDHVSPDTITISAVIKAWTNSHSEFSGSRAESILVEMLRKYEDGERRFKPDKVIFHAVMLAYSNEATKTSGENAEKVLRGMQRLHERRPELDIKPTIDSYNLVIEAYANASSQDSSMKSERLLEEIELEESEGISELKANADTIRFVLHSFTKKQNAADMDKIHYYFERLRDITGQPDDRIYNMVLEYYAFVGCAEAVRRSSKLLDELKVIAKQEEREKELTLKVQNYYLQALANSNWVEAVPKAEKFFKQIQKPNISSYNHLINVHANSKTLSGAEKAESILQSLTETHSRVLPNISTYNNVIKAWALSGSDESIDKIGNIFHKMNNSSIKRNKPNQQSYEYALTAFTKKASLESAERAKKLLYQIDRQALHNHGDVMTNVKHFNTVLESYANCCSFEGAQKAAELLSYMEESYYSEKISFPPNAQSYITVMKAWALSGASNVGKKASRILVKMENFAQGEKHAINPNKAAIHMVMKAYRNDKLINSGENAEQFLHLLHEMESNGYRYMKPDTESYKLVVEAYANSSSKQGAERAEKILNEMEELSSQGGNVKLHREAMISVIEAWSRKGDFAERAENVLKKMEFYYREGYESLQPDRLCYETVIKAYENEGRNDMARAVRLRMENS